MMARCLIVRHVISDTAQRCVDGTRLIVVGFRIIASAVRLRHGGATQQDDQCFGGRSLLLRVDDQPTVPFGLTVMVKLEQVRRMRELFAK